MLRPRMNSKQTDMCDVDEITIASHRWHITGWGVANPGTKGYHEWVTLHSWPIGLTVKCRNVTDDERRRGAWNNAEVVCFSNIGRR